MDKRSYYLNNISHSSIWVGDLNIIIPPGIFNLFELNVELNFEQIDYSTRKGALRSIMENGLCKIVPDIVTQSISKDVIVRNSYQIQVLQNRAKFQAIQVEESIIFDPIDDAGLFENDEVKPARQIEEELKKANEFVQTIEATVKDLPEKPIENRYTPPAIKTPEAQQKIKNDIAMGYETCNGLTAQGLKCMRRAKTGKGFCGWHNK